MEKQYFCSVCLSTGVVFNFSGDIKKIDERLRFISSSLYITKTETGEEDNAWADYLKDVPVTIVDKEDFNDVVCFSLRNTRNDYFFQKLLNEVDQEEESGQEEYV